MYTVSEVQRVLRYWGMDFSEPYIRDLLREGVIPGGHIQSKKKGWTVAESDVEAFVKQRVPAARERKTLVNA